MQRSNHSVRIKTILPLAILGTLALIQFTYLFSTFSALKHELEKKINLSKTFFMLEMYGIIMHQLHCVLYITYKWR